MTRDVSGETAAVGGLREAREEAGVHGVTGLNLLRIEQTENRFRWILHCRATSDSLKEHADADSQGARWVTLHECAAIDKGLMQHIEHCWLRGVEPLKWFEHLSAGRPSFPLSEFVHMSSERGGKDHGRRTAYNTRSDGRIVVIHKTSGQKLIISNTALVPTSMLLACFHSFSLLWPRFISTAICGVRRPFVRTYAFALCSQGVCCCGFAFNFDPGTSPELHLWYSNASEG
jgi:hypothetical protein